jgi:lysozyme
MKYTNLRDMLVQHEGLKLEPYLCPAGKLTIGIGRNLEDRGISIDEAQYLLMNDISRCRKEAMKEGIY